ncbi:MAG: DUF3306 domain-containing protein [Burkholderiales bacterium]|nr:DUF3306 domain-containing protein [Burkholderiales bacterium]
MTAPEQKPKETAEEFLSRWSRRKQQLREESQTPRPAQVPAAEAEAPELPAVESLGVDSDYRGFFHPKVDEALRRTALKKLFSDPHFNIMDGLDTYIDDYSISEPIPAAILAEMKSAQNILGWARETEEEAELRRNPPPVDAAQIAAADPGAADVVPAVDAAEPDTALPEPAEPEPDDDNKST